MYLIQAPLDRILRCKRPSNFAYQRLFSLKQDYPTKSQEKWLLDCDLAENFVDWRATYKLIISFQCTKITKLIVFQFKLINRRLSTNDFLNKIGFLDLKMISVPSVKLNQKDGPPILLLWNNQYLLAKTKETTGKRKTNSRESSLSVKKVLCLKCVTSPPNHQLNFAILVARFFIWHCKINERYPKNELFSQFFASFNAF